MNLQRLCNLEILISDDVEASWLILKNTLLESLAKHTSMTWKKKPKILPFLTPKIKKLCNRKKKLWQKFVKQKKTTAYEKYKIARNLLRKETRKLTVNYKEHLAKNVKENPKLFWKHISLHKPGRHSVPDLENNSSVSSCASEKANLLNNQFVSVFSKDDLQSALPPAEQAHTVFPMLHSPITVEETDWSHRKSDQANTVGEFLVLVRKADGSLRICLDPVDLNRAIERPHYPIPLFDEVAAKCKGAKKFFKMDAQNGYWSMVLDKPSSELTTFNTMYGWYKWNQYPFGLISVQDEYQ
ncbi:hypothetical protein QYM36_000338 [Artemia franciscana]|uniref:Reverse transcriptase n=1 Tax=Artemia franciscana TaxID=6661 RepID=A0AA88IQC1_ARTSF|nr:hypothetical protein QYM36_000338 [Artemia franciscana]